MLFRMLFEGTGSTVDAAEVKDVVAREIVSAQQSGFLESF